MRNHFRRLSLICHIQFTSIPAQYCSTHAKPVCVCACVCVRVRVCVCARALDSFFCPAVCATIYHMRIFTVILCIHSSIACYTNLTRILQYCFNHNVHNDDATHLKVAQRNLFFFLLHFIAHGLHNQILYVCIGLQHIFYRIVTFSSLLNLNKMLHN